MPEFIEWKGGRTPPRRRFVMILAVAVVLLLGSRTGLSYYVNRLWFESLGYGDVFLKSLSLQWTVFAGFSAATFFILYGWFLALKRAYQPDLLSGGVILIGGQPLKLPVERILRNIVLVAALLIAAVTGASMGAEWPTFSLYWFAPRAAGSVVDPIFGKPLSFYLFTLPAWQFLTGWLLTLAVIACVIAVFFVLITGSARVFGGKRGVSMPSSWRGFSIAFAFLLLVLAVRVYLSRFDALVRGAHSLFRGQLHGRTRDPDGIAGSVLGAGFRSGDCLHQYCFGSAGALAGGSVCSGRGLLCCPPTCRLVCGKLYRQAE